jgi:hypothetical protein
MTMTARCPSDLALERHLLEPDSAPLGEHLTSCGRCVARLEEMRRQGEAFQQYVFPATVEAVEAAARPTRWRLARWLALGPALAGVGAAVILLVRPAAPPDEIVLKGSGLGISVFVKEGSSVRAISDGEAVRADASLRFKVRAASTCRLWILSLDANGEVSRLYPGEGTGGAEVFGTVEIPGGAILDGQSGPERIYAVCTPGPSKWRALAAQLRGGSGAGEATVRAAPSPAALPAGAQLATVLVEKRT